jgi:hypothetical protein
VREFLKIQVSWRRTSAVLGRVEASVNVGLDLSLIYVVPSGVKLEVSVITIFTVGLLLLDLLHLKHLHRRCQEHAWDQHITIVSQRRSERETF